MPTTRENASLCCNACGKAIKRTTKHESGWTGFSASGVGWCHKCYREHAARRARAWARGEWIDG